ncbi:hypothetical protein IPM62_03775 [Candidatus Woesebacteria bacterium]|nr:MAG: hypothetical protein IPM62_03775 [Candidatus Woesebacteria bacterium]
MKKYILPSIVFCIFLLFLLSILFTKPQKSLPKQPLDTPSSYVATDFSVSGWLPWWDFDKGAVEISENKNTFTSVSPFIYELNDDLTITSRDQTGKTASILKNHPELEIIPSVSNNFKGENVSKIINSTELSENHISQLVDLALPYDGIELNYEQLLAEDKNAYTKFIDTLSKKLHADNKKLAITLHPKTTDKGVWHATAAQDWEKLAQSVDYMRIMTYDYHWNGSVAGPIAPIDWLHDVTEYANKTIPKEKRILGIGLYAYDWQIGTTQGDDLTLNEVAKILNKEGVEKFYDENFQSPYLTYTKDGIHRIIWYENTKSFAAKLKLAHENYAGIALWKMGDIPETFYLTLK